MGSGKWEENKTTCGPCLRHTDNTLTFSHFHGEKKRCFTPNVYRLPVTVTSHLHLQPEIRTKLLLSRYPTTSPRLVWNIIGMASDLIRVRVLFRRVATLPRPIRRYTSYLEFHHRDGQVICTGILRLSSSRTQINDLINPDGLTMRRLRMQDGSISSLRVIRNYDSPSASAVELTPLLLVLVV